ncbi:uncharacterized protein LOC129053086 isoform X2 [Pongo abelii]|uniref:uncharacterized protein LOC129053086 isoform X2 n=1 Tax=Pongo abelii TaxID=9601 RepID=UPI0023E8EFCB|nr:uncharacterized protein LOC129053086 isoform X2 [Pongo abelii]
MTKQSSRVWLCLVTRKVYIGSARALGHLTGKIQKLQKPTVDKKIVHTMDDEHPSTSGEKRKSPCDTNYQNEELENHRENAINPVQLYEEMMEVDVETPAKE